MKMLSFRIESSRPLLMQAETLANPLSSITQARKAVAGKRKKTEDDHNWLLHIEWKASLYHDSEIGPYLPAINIESCIADAAKATRQGRLVKQALCVMTDKSPLEYDGPRDVAGLYGGGSSAFVDMRGVNVNGKKVMRARPQFLKWAAEFDVSVMDDLLDPADVVRIVEHAGRVIGIGTYRPRFGRFEIASVKEA